MQEERKGRALTKVQYAWAKRDLRHFKGAHEDRAMQGAQQKSANGGPMSIADICYILGPKSLLHTQLASSERSQRKLRRGIITFMWNCELTTGHILCYAFHAKGPHLLASSS